MLATGRDDTANLGDWKVWRYGNRLWKNLVAKMSLEPGHVTCVMWSDALGGGEGTRGALGRPCAGGSILVWPWLALVPLSMFNLYPI